MPWPGLLPGNWIEASSLAEGEQEPLLKEPKQWLDIRGGTFYLTKRSEGQPHLQQENQNVLF